MNSGSEVVLTNSGSSAGTKCGINQKMRNKIRKRRTIVLLLRQMMDGNELETSKGIKSKGYFICLDNLLGLKVHRVNTFNQYQVP